jgi:prevent-host-death family protein
MKPPKLSDDVVPVQDLRAALARYIERVDKTGRPVIITQRGRAAAALVSTAMLDALEDERELLRKALRGLAQAQGEELPGQGSLWRKAKKRLAGAAEPDGPPAAAVEPAAPEDDDAGD